jgi:hypothetical protein
VLHRFDGVSVRLEGGSYNRIRGEVGRVPHDIAHLIVEDALGLGGGLWGTLAAGGIVQNAILAGGRKPPHAERRARAITHRAGESLRQAEILVRATADVSLDGGTRDMHALHARVGARWWSPSITPDALERACVDLREAANAGMRCRMVRCSGFRGHDERVSWAAAARRTAPTAHAPAHARYAAFARSWTTSPT